MMAFLFGLFSIAIGAALLRRRQLSIVFILTGIFFSLLMFWHHATSILEINW